MLCWFHILWTVVPALVAANDSGSNGLPSNFVVGGECRFESIQQNGSVTTVKVDRFRVLKSNDVWSVRLDSLDRVGETQELYYDQTNLWIVSRLPGGSSLRIPGLPVPDLQAQGSGDSSIPVAVISPRLKGVAVGASSVVWLALLSEPSLRRTTKGVRVPWRASDNERQCFKWEVDWDQEAGLPSKVRFIASRQLWEERLAELSQTGGPLPYYSYPDGFLAGEFEVGNWTNVAAGGVSFRFPGRFRVDKYHDPAAHAAQPISQHFECVISQISLEVPNISRPEIAEERVQVHDTRVRTADFPEAAASYVITNHVWPETNSEIVQMAWTKSVRMAQGIRGMWAKAGSAQRAKRTMQIILGGSLLALVVAAFLWRPNEKGCD
jgi:hypothetical protein